MIKREYATLLLQVEEALIVFSAARHISEVTLVPAKYTMQFQARVLLGIQ